MLQEIADLLEITGENPFKVRAYRKAAREIENLGEDLATHIAAGTLQEIPGIGEAIAAKITQFVQTGRLPYLEELRKKVPPGVKQLLSVPGVGPHLAHLFYQRLGIDSLEALEKAAKDHRLRELPGVGAKVELNILHGLERLRNRPSRYPLGLAKPIAEELCAGLRKLPQVVRAEVAGSIRRWKETVGDIDLLVAAEDPLPVIAYLTSLPAAVEVLASGDTKASILHRSGLQVDLRVVRPEEFAAAWVYLTGSKEHNLRLREMAQQQGAKLNEYGLFREPGDQPYPLAAEEDLYRYLGMPYIPPELREDRGEIEAALEHRLPVLVERKHLRGDLHVHTRWSDGVSTLREMRDAAARLGYEYLAICDHSHSLGITGGLDAARLRQQAAEIAALNAEGSPVTLLKGIEVDILADGRLDLPDEVLAELDIVVASIHTAMKQSAEQLWLRVERALRNPHVDILAHPSGRLLGHRGPHALELERVIDLAAETGTVLEINSFPDRLDLDDLMARRAAEKGVILSINTDAHSHEQLAYMAFGVATARRGWVGPEKVLNTLPLPKLLERLKSHRG